MKFYIYAKSSHRDELDNVRRCSALAKMLKNYTPTLCTGDYRAASIARDTLGVPDSMGIDAMGNLPYTMERLDILIYDNEDVTIQMKNEMEEYTSKLSRVGKEIPYDIVDLDYFAKHESVLQKAIFFSDDDYAKWFFNFCQDSKKYDIPLLNGNYFFLDTLKEYEKSFREVIDEEEYFDVVSETEHLLCANVHTCLESLAAGHKPVFFQRLDKEVAHLELIEKYNIPTAYGTTLDELVENFESIIENYPKTGVIEKFDATFLAQEISEVFQNHSHIVPAMDYEYYYAK